MKQKSKLLKPCILKTLVLSPLLITTITLFKGTTIYTAIHNVEKNNQKIADTMEKEEAEKQFYRFNTPEKRQLTEKEKHAKMNLVTKIKKISDHSHETNTPQLISLGNIKPEYVKKLYSEDIEYSEWKYNKPDMGFVFVYKREATVTINSLFHHNYRNSNINDDIMIYDPETKNAYKWLNNSNTTFKKTVLLKLRLRDDINIETYGGFKNKNNEKSILIKIWIKNKIKEEDIVFNNNTLKPRKETISIKNNITNNQQVYKINKKGNLSITIKDPLLQQPQYKQLFNNEKSNYEKTSYCVKVGIDKNFGHFINDDSKNYFNGKTINIEDNGIYFLNIIDYLGNQYQSYLEVSEENWGKIEKLNTVNESSNTHKESEQETAKTSDNSKSEQETAKTFDNSKSEQETAKTSDNSKSEQEVAKTSDNSESKQAFSNNIKNALETKSKQHWIAQSTDETTTKILAESTIDQWFKDINKPKDLSITKDYVPNSYRAATALEDGMIKYKITVKNGQTIISTFYIEIKLNCALIPTNTNCDKELENTKIINKPKAEKSKTKNNIYKGYRGKTYFISKVQRKNQSDNNSNEKIDITKEEEDDIKQYLLWIKPKNQYKRIIKRNNSEFRIYFGEEFRDWELLLTRIADIKARLNNVNIIYFYEIPKNNNEKIKMLREYLISKYQLKEDEFEITNITAKNEATIIGKNKFTGSMIITIREKEEVKTENDDFAQE